MVSWTYNTSWVYKKLYSGLDPFQNASMPDCYLISALSSLAWACRVNIQNPNPTTGDVPLTIGGKNYVAAKTETLPVGASGNLLGATSSAPNETWPAIYEKMYAEFLGIPPDPTGNPDVCNKMPLNGNALTTLVDLTSWTANSDVSGNYSTIFSNLTPNKLANDTKTKYPVVAWTALPSGISTGYLVMPKHAYSVLGTYTDSTGSYIVLRNPLGSVAQNPGINMKTSGSWTYLDRCFKRTTEITAGYTGGVPPTKTLNFNPAQGLFALEVSEFAKYFDRFGWLT